MERRTPRGSRNENPKSPMRRVAGCGIEGWDGDGFVRCARKTGGESESWDGVWRRGEMSFSRDGARCSGPQKLGNCVEARYLRYRGSQVQLRYPRHLAEGRLGALWVCCGCWKRRTGDVVSQWFSALAH